MTTLPFSKYIIILTATSDALGCKARTPQIPLPTKKDPNTLTLKDHGKLHLLKSNHSLHAGIVGGGKKKMYIQGKLMLAF